VWSGRIEGEEWKRMSFSTFLAAFLRRADD
jgi:hypothetical protein